jgi:hypothetical protein
MRVLNIDGPGLVQEEDFCPNCFVLLDEREGYKVCRLCPYETRQGIRRPRVRVRRSANEQETSGMTSFSRAQHPLSAISSRKTSVWPS